MIKESCSFQNSPYKSLSELTAGRRFDTAVPDDVMTTAGLRDPLA